MKKLRLFGLFSMLFALALIIPGCSSNDPAPVTNDKDGMLYLGRAPDNNYVVLGIWDENGARAAFVPQGGFLYAIVVVSEENITDIDDFDSAGTITVSGSSVTFKPYPGMGESFTGTMGNNNITLRTVPGTTYSNIKADETYAFNAGSSDDPWNGGSFPGFPGGQNPGPGPGDPDEPDPTPDPAPTGTNYVPGKYITRIDFSFTPPSSSGDQYVRDGDRITLPDGIRAVINYNDGSSRTVQDKSSFAIEPPYYDAYNTNYTLTYTAEYNTSSYPLINFVSSLGKTMLRLNANDGITTKDKLNRVNVYFDDDTFDFDGATINATADYSSSGGGSRTVGIPPDLYKIEWGWSWNANSDSDNAVFPHLLTLKVGSGTLNIKVKERYDYNAVSKVEFVGTPSFGHVIYDDPRLVGTGYDPLFWLDKIGQAKLSVTYLSTTPSSTRTRQMSVLKAYENQPSTNSVIDPPKGYEMGGKPMLTINYFGKGVTQLIQPYDRLTKIELTSRDGAVIVMNGRATPPDDESDFLKRIKISATYQKGSNKNDTVTRDNILTYNPIGSSVSDFIDPATVDSYAELKTNVLMPSIPGDPGILSKANSDSYTSSKNRKSKATVTFTTGPVGGGTQSTKSATIEVGVIGYTNP